MAQKIKRRLLPACALALALGCGGSAGNPQNPDVAAPTPDAESTPDGGVGVDGGTSSESGAARTLSGAVKDQASVPVVGAKVQVGTSSVFSDGQGLYTLAGVDQGIDGGRIVLVVTRDWFQPYQAEVTMNEGGNTRHDITLEEKPLILEPADVAAAKAYNVTFDWSRQKLSIAIVAPATRRNFDNAVYWQNPALYRDTSSIAPLVPSPAPQIVGVEASNFSFPIRGGVNDGKEALDLTSIVDSIAATPVTAMATTDYMLWTPMLNWLTDWDPAKSADLKMAGVAVRQQNWGSNLQRPQEIQRVYLDTANGVLWVEVVFAKFVQLGEGITDNDGDGYKEIFAKIDPLYASQGIRDRLVEYGQTVYGTHGMSKEVTKALREIYSTTSAVVERFIGQPFDIPGLGTIQYPFVVLKHAGGQENVILVGP